MKRKFVIAFPLLIVCIAESVLAQEKKETSWVINEVYVADIKPKPYGLFVELFNPVTSKIPFDLFLTTNKNYPDQFRLKLTKRYSPDFRKPGYKTFRISIGRFKRRTIKIQYNQDSLYLFKVYGNQISLEDAFPIPWKDELANGRCNNNEKHICRFTVATPGFPNKNVNPKQFIPRKFYSTSFFAGASTATHTGFANHALARPSWGIQVSRVINRRKYYSTVHVKYFHHEYGFNTTETTSGLNGTIIRDLKGYYYADRILIGKEAGLFVTNKLDIFAGISLGLGSFEQQKFNEKRTFIPLNGPTIEEEFKQRYTIENTHMLLNFTGGVKYSVTPTMHIQLSYFNLFRTQEKKEVIFYHCVTLGVSFSFKGKGMGYKESFLGL